MTEHPSGVESEDSFQVGQPRSTADAKRIWMYWEDFPGKHRAPYLDLCLETIELHAGQMPVTVLDRRSVHNHIDLDRRRWDDLPNPVYRADYARVRLLHAHGGLWVDFDTIALRPLCQLLDNLADHDAVGFGQEIQGRFYNSILSSRPGSSVMASWLAQQDEAIARGIKGYAALGQDISWEMSTLAGHWHIEKVAPVMWWEWQRFCSRLESPSRILNASPIVIVLWNAAIGQSVATRTRASLLKDNILLSSLFRIALGMTCPDEEETWLTQLSWVNAIRYSRYAMAMHARRKRYTIRKQTGLP